MFAPHGSTVDPRQHDYISPATPTRPSPRSFNTYPVVDQASSWNNPYHEIITNFPHPSIADHAEHSLRRKTPNGTIDNGYDGTPTQLAGGPRPPKFLAGDIFPNANSCRTRPFPVASNPAWYPASQSGRTGGDETGPLRLLTPGGGGYGQGNMGYSPVHRPMLNSPSVQMHHMNLGNPSARNNYGLGTAYQNQAMASPSVMSPAAGFNSNVIWADGPLGGFHPGMQMSSTGYPPHNIPYEVGYSALQAPLPQGPIGGIYGQIPPFPMPGMLDDGFSRHGLPSMLQSPHGLQNLSIGSNPTSARDGPPQTFREGVLASAHRAYSDLVAHVTRLKKVQHGKTSSRSLKSIIFPRPPKHLASRPTSHLQRSHQSFPGAVTGYPHRQITPNMNGQMVQPGLMANYGLDPSYLPSTRLDATGHAFDTHPTVTGAVYGSAMLQSNPRESAKKYLEMLTNLCEQSDWQWIDGMLMGGCLHYSLEHYEEAEEWFKRIVTLDAG